jgi:hypothetical protein
MCKKLGRGTTLPHQFLANILYHIKTTKMSRGNNNYRNTIHKPSYSNIWKVSWKNSKGGSWTRDPHPPDF